MLKKMTNVLLGPRRQSLNWTIALLSLSACMPSTPESEIEVSLQPVARLEPSSPREKLQALDEVISSNARVADDLADVRSMLQAEDLAEQGRWQEASRQWFNALGVARGRFGKRALEGWIKSYTKALGKKSDRVVLTRLLLAETQMGQYSPYMRARSLTTETALVPLVETNAPEWLLPTNERSLSLPPPDGKGVPSNDPVLVKTAAQLCKNSRANASDIPAGWETWHKSLSPELQRYWRGLVLQCSGRTSEALEILVNLYPTLAKNKATQAHAIEAASRSAAMQRALVQRKQAADTYLAQIPMWSLAGVTPSAMGLDNLAFARRRIDEAMWAARYRAMIGDYENGKIFSHKALEWIANAYADAPAASLQTKEELASLRAEAYHTLAYRIALENKEFQSALAMTLQALETPNLNTEWQERLSWFAGVYDYLGGHFEAAKTKWERLLAKTKDDSLRAMLYYWLANVHNRLEHPAESRFYLKTIVDEYPLSYYSTVAPLISGLKPENDWRELFRDTRALSLKLERSENLQVSILRQNPTVAPLLRRAEALIAAELNSWARLALDELETAINNDFQPETNADAFVYLTRLQYSGGNYLAAIGQTTKLAKSVEQFWRRYPEQILIYFPRPYADIYTRNASDSGVEKSLLLAISRQESGFTPDIRSGANAIGIMQLIRPTAERFSDGLTFTGSMDEALKNPELNIKMGSRYLRELTLHYKSFWPGVYGGYNAGEFAVDTWLKRRGHSDPLMFIELVPFGETKDYIKNVWRNMHVYKFLDATRLNYRSPRLADPALESGRSHGSRSGA